MSKEEISLLSKLFLTSFFKERIVRINSLGQLPSGESDRINAVILKDQKGAGSKKRMSGACGNFYRLSEPGPIRLVTN